MKEDIIIAVMKHRSGNAKVISSNPVEARFVFGLILQLL